MEPLRLDPADPLASVLRWLAALAAALGIDPARRTSRVQLNHASATVVRRWLADCSRQLRAVIRVEAGRLAQGLLSGRPAPLSVGCPGTVAAIGDGPASAGAGRRKRSLLLHLGRFAAVAGRGRSGVGTREETRTTVRPAPDAWLDPAQDTALRRRTRAVLFVLHDRSAVVRRLSLRLAKHLARHAAARDARLGRRRFPHPSRVDRAIPRALVLAPEPRPPDRCASVLDLRHAPRTPAAAAPAFARQSSVRR